MVTYRTFLESVFYHCNDISTALNKMPSKQTIQKMGYGLSIFGLLVYVVCVFSYITKISTATTPDALESEKPFINFDPFVKGVPLSQDATKNQLLKFYGHENLLQRPDVFRPSSEILTSLHYNFSITSPDACPQGSKPTLVIMVLTEHNHYLHRKAIRETWGSVAKNRPWPGKRLHGDVRLIFLLGKSKEADLNSRVAKEALITKDIVQSDVQESYYNLTLKVLLGFQWVDKFCPGAQFIMKIDEDTFIDLPRILNLLVSLEWDNTIYGPYSFAEKVQRDNSSKSAVQISAYPLEWYPPHVKGNMYIMPVKLAMDIANVSQYFPYVNMEDVHITGILAKVFDARHVGIPEDLYIKHHHRDPNLCDFVTESKIASQGVYPALAYSFWNRIQNTQLCGIVSVDKVLQDFSNRKDIVQNMVYKPEIDQKKTDNVYFKKY